MRKNKEKNYTKQILDFSGKMSEKFNGHTSISVETIRTF